MPSQARIFEKVYELEGVFSNHPEDTGGETHWGITLPFWKEVTGQDEFPVPFEQAHAEKCYTYLWDKMSVEVIPSDMRLCYFAFGMVAGWPTAIKILQRSTGVKDDGILGPNTKRSILSVDPYGLYTVFVLKTIKHYWDCKNFQTFGRGWLNRLAQTIIPLEH